MKTLTIQFSNIFQSILTLAFFLLMEVTTWLPLRFWAVWGGGGFIDTTQILNYSECFSAFKFGIYDANDSDCSGYIYGRTLLVFLDFLGLGLAHSFTVGIFLLFLLSIILSYCLPVKNLKDAFFYLLIVLSPPVMLLAERGNFDILMVGLVFLAGIQLSKGRVIISALIIASATLIKFYTGPLFLIVLVKSRGFRSKILVSMIAVSTAYVTLVDLSKMNQGFPRALGFGFEVWGEYLNQYSSTTGSTLRNQLLAVITFSVCVFLAIRLKFSGLFFPVSFVHQDNRNKLIANLLWLSLMSSYFLGLSFDYRLIFLAISVLLFIQSQELDGSRESYLYWMLVSILWLSFPSSGVAPIGDLLLELMIASASVSYFIYLRPRFSRSTGRGSPKAT